MKNRHSAPGMTADEYARLPEGEGIDELRAGVVLSEPRPFPRHGRIQAEFAVRLGEHVTPRRLGVVLTDSGFLLSENPDTVRAPDVAFVHRDRYDPRQEARAFFRGAPDLAVEILSPSNRPEEISAKVADFLAAGCRLVWVVDPDRRCAEVYRTPLEPRRIPEAGVLEGDEVLPGFTVSLRSVLDP